MMSVVFRLYIYRNFLFLLCFMRIPEYSGIVYLSDCDSGCRGFESHQPPHKIKHLTVPTAGAFLLGEALARQ